MTARDLVLALYELNGGDYDKMVRDMTEHHNYPLSDLKKATADFNKEHQGQNVVTITDPDYPMQYRKGYVKPPLVIIDGRC